ncbi:MAG: TonB-dependent receptor [Muribaculaceae bacterium]|nr:TonB-dependent receptor [Muribaculaceae bacterium]
MKSKIFFLNIFIFSFLQIQSAEIKGRLFNPTFNEGEPYATIRIYSVPTTPLTQAQMSEPPKPDYTFITDENGEFFINIEKDDHFILEFSAIGKEPVFRDIDTRKEAKIDLGDIEMKEDVKNLGEITVIAQRPLVEMKTDEMTYNVSSDNDSKTYSLLEMLRKVPMVTVDGEDNISVNGSSNFQVYVDGKPSLLFSGNPSQIFKAMPASSVQKIEVVTNPGAKYDAEGVGGVLNLVMNKMNGNSTSDTKAYNVSVNIRGGNRGIGGNIYANGQIGKLSASLNLIENYSVMGSSEMITERTEGSLITESVASSKPKLPFTLGNISLNYDVDSLTTIGASFSLNKFSNNYNGSINTLIHDETLDLFKYSEWSKNKGGRQGLNGSLNISREFGSERNHQLNVTYQISSEKQNSLVTNDFTVEFPTDLKIDDRRSDSKLKTTEQIILADFSSKFKNNKISIGLKGTFRNAKADNSYYLNDIYDGQGSLDYKNDNKIGAAYAEYAYNNSLFNLKAGLRYEYTWQSISYRNSNIQGYSDNYGNLVPSGSIGFNLTHNSNIGLNYNMRISRPGISYLNPYVNQADPTQITYGNPDLDIEKTQNVSLVYNLFTSQISLNATLSNSFTGNGIEQYSFLEDGILNTTYGNIVKKNLISLNAFLNWRIGKKTSIMFNGGGSYVDLKSKELMASNHGFQGNFMLGIQQQFPMGINGNVFMIMSTKNKSLQGWNSGFKMLAVNFSKSFIKDKLSLSLGFNTGLSKGGKMMIENFVETPSFSNKTTIKVPMLAVNLGITFKFGSTARVKEVKSSHIENDFIDTKSQMESISNSDTNGSPNR